MSFKGCPVGGILSRLGLVKQSLLLLWSLISLVTRGFEGMGLDIFDGICLFIMLVTSPFRRSQFSWTEYWPGSSLKKCDWKDALSECRLVMSALLNRKTFLGCFLLYLGLRLIKKLTMRWSLIPLPLVTSQFSIKWELVVKTRSRMLRVVPDIYVWVS